MPVRWIVGGSLALVLVEVSWGDGSSVFEWRGDDGWRLGHEAR